MLYGYETMYQLLDRYAENAVDDAEHAYINSLKWQDSIVLHIRSCKFWQEMERLYEITLSAREKAQIATVEDLKRVLRNA